MRTQATNRVLGYIRGQLTDGGTKGEYANLLVALDQPVWNLMLHKDVAATCSGSIGYSISREQQLYAEDLKVNGRSKAIKTGTLRTSFSWERYANI